jgi:hypothetical protein
MGGIAVKKGLTIAAGIAGATFIASAIMKRLNNTKVGEEKSADEKIQGENTADQRESTGVKPEVKKTKNHNENMVRVNNSLVSIKIKVFSK